MTNVRRVEMRSSGFSLLEVLVSATVLALILVALLGVLNIVSGSFQSTSGKLDSFDSARAAFDALTRVVRQATLLSHLGYDDPAAPTAHRLKSDLHFLSGPQKDLGLNNTGSDATHALFFQSPLGVASDADLQNSNLLLNATGFFIAYGDDPIRPPVLGNKTETRHRFRLFQFFQPREDMTVYDYTITRQTGIPASNDAFMGSDWFRADVQARKFCHPLAENVIALFVLPVVEGKSADSYLWNSRDAATVYSHHRLPQALKVVMAVIDERSAARLGNTAAAPDLLPVSLSLFEDSAEFDSDLEKLELALTEFDPPLNYRIFTAEVPLNPSNTNL